MAERSYNDIQGMIRAALPDPPKDQYLWIRDVFPSKVIYDLDNKVYERTYVIDDAGKVTLGDAVEVEAQTVYEPVIRMAAFSMDTTIEDGDTVLWKGKIFEAGDYPDKGVTITEEDLDAMVATFSPVDINLEHIEALHDVKTVLDGKLGRLEAIFRKGKELFGKARVPKWLDAVVPKKARRVSVELVGQALDGLALVINPRVTDAALMAAFTTFAGKRHSKGDVADIQTIHDFAVKQGAACTKSSAMSAGSNTPAMSGSGGKPKMNLFEKIAAFVKGGQPDEFDPVKLTYDGKPVEVPEADKVAPATNEQPKPAEPDAAFKAQLDSMQLQLTNAAEATLREKASAYADTVVAAHKAVPAQKEQIAALFVQAVKADAGGKALFSADGTLVEGASVKALREFHDKTPAHIFTDAVTAAGSLTAIGTEAGTALSPERKEALLKTTPAGRAVLAENKEAK